MKKYDHKKSEKHWQAKWLKEKIYEPDLKNPRGGGKFYNLMMFPYPSAEGLHVGNMYAFTGSDIYGRLKRMQGFDVFEPIGLDGFGIHSENYAIKNGKHPADQAKISQKRFYKQLEAIGNGFAWQEKLETYDPEYYRWTQWIFVQMFKNGLAYRAKARVNWCPSCLTVLADEQVLAGECERCGTKVIKKELEQWFFKITKYADKLLANLNKIDWPEKIKVAQRNWIGKSEGALIGLKVKGTDGGIENLVEVFTTRPDTLFGATYLVLAPEHDLVKNLESRIQNLEEANDYIQKAKIKTQEERIAENHEKTGIELKGVKAINPANQKEISVWVADYVMASYGTGAIMAVPAHDERDLEFAKKFNLPVIKVIEANQNEKEVWEGDGTLINSGRFDGMDSQIAKQEITKFVGGKITTAYRLRDWLISRQRYWGPPIPMIYCEECGWQPVPEKDLPVILPKLKDFRPTGTDKSPLASVEKFYKVKCLNCGGEARRETDVSDTFLDSAWYYLRYPSVKNQKVPFNSKITRNWLPVDMYIGGVEHAVLHLLYIRFLAMAFYDLGLIHFEEPVIRFRAHGLLINDGAKMSKSRGNVVNPDEYIKKYGADVLRMYLMFLGPFELGGDFRDESISGITRFISKVWGLKKNLIKADNQELEKKIHKTVKKITEDVEKLHYNTAISELMVLAREIDRGGASQKQFETFLKLLAPFAPYISEEIWRNVLKNKKCIHTESWPSYNPHLIAEITVDVVVQINGKTRAMITAARGTPEEEVIKIVLDNQKIKKCLEGKEIKKTIFVPNRLVNFVVVGKSDNNEKPRPF